jgi:small-conductance mechanosensitive channel
MSELVLEIPGKKAGLEPIQTSPSALPDEHVSGSRLTERPPWVFHMTLALITMTLTIFPAAFLFVSHMAFREGSWVNRLAAAEASLIDYEIYRWSILCSLGLFSFFASMAVLSVVPRLTREADPGLRNLGLNLARMKGRVSFVVASVVVYGLFAGMGLDSVDISGDMGKDSRTILAGSYFLRLAKLLVVGVDDVMSYMTNSLLSLRPLMLRLPRTMLLLSIVILLERLLVVRISSAFHKNFYTARIRTNNIAISCMEALQRRFPNKNGRKLRAGMILTDDEAFELAERVFAGLCEPVHDSITLHDLQEVLGTSSDVNVFYEYLDSNSSGDVNLAELKESFQEAYAEKDSLRQQLASNEEVVSNLDGFFLVLTVLAFVILFMPVLDLTIYNMFALVVGGVATFSFAFEHIYAEITNALIFILVTHPYDIGDRVMIKGAIYVVREFGLWTTKLETGSGRFVYMTNTSICHTPVLNFRRSDPQDDTASICLPAEVTEAQVAQLVASLNAFVRAHHRQFDAPVVIKSMKIENSCVYTVKLALKHQYNYQNQDACNERRSIFARHLNKLAQEQNLKIFSFSY